MDDNLSAEELSPKYKRVILKISGEGFCPAGKSGISIDETLNIARQAQRIVQRGVQLAIVVGAGNILRGAQFSARRRGDHGDGLGISDAWSWHDWRGCHGCGRGGCAWFDCGLASSRTIRA